MHASKFIAVRCEKHAADERATPLLVVIAACSSRSKRSGIRMTPSLHRKDRTVRTISKSIYLGSLGLFLMSLVASGCATHDSKRDDETYKRPTKAEKAQEESQK